MSNQPNRPQGSATSERRSGNGPQPKTGQRSSPSASSVEGLSSRDGLHGYGEYLEKPQELIREYPGSSALVTFGVGCFVGMMTAWMLMPQRRPDHWYDRLQAPEWASSRRLSQAMERVPETVSRYFSHR